MTDPVVAIALGTEVRADRAPRLIQNRAYFRALEQAGAVPLPIPVVSVATARALYERSDALCLAGGPDVDPRRYGEQPAEGCDVVPDPELDALEFDLLEWALADDRPVLGICRGLQLLNVALGGTLWQDLVRQRSGSIIHRPDGGERFDLCHAIAIEPGSRLHEIVGRERLEVNSLHHQGIRDLAPGLRVSARSDDGLTEAVELQEHRYVVAVQSHPEELTNGGGWARDLMRSLAIAAGG